MNNKCQSCTPSYQGFPPEYFAYTYKCNDTYSIPPNYPPRNKKLCQGVPCVPPGYQQKRRNPGGLKFYLYDYPLQTNYGQQIGLGGELWRIYNKTGEYYGV